MQVLLTGGTGFIGSELLKYLNTHQILLLTRNPKKAKQSLQHVDHGHIRYIDSLDHLTNLDSYDAVINLAGEPIADKRWTKKQKQVICNSRWHITEQLVSLIHESTTPPSVFISGSAVGYYGDQQDRIFDESFEVSSTDFTHLVCKKWESIAMLAQSEHTRVCLLRTGVVLDNDGGALKKMLPPAKLGMGTIFGNGRQYMPWIHRLDMVRGILFLLETKQAQGVFNFCAPHPVQNRDFMKALTGILHKPLFLAPPQSFFTLLMGESSHLLFDSIRAKPKHLTDLGFHFSFSRIEPALKHLFTE